MMSWSDTVQSVKSKYKGLNPNFRVCQFYKSPPPEPLGRGPVGWIGPGVTKPPERACALKVVLEFDLPFEKEEELKDFINNHTQFSAKYSKCVTKPQPIIKDADYVEEVLEILRKNGKTVTRTDLTQCSDESGVWPNPLFTTKIQSEEPERTFLICSFTISIEQQEDIDKLHDIYEQFFI